MGYIDEVVSLFLFLYFTLLLTRFNRNLTHLFRLVGLPLLSLLGERIVELASRQEFVEPCGVGQIGSITFFLHLFSLEFFEKHLA